MSQTEDRQRATIEFVAEEIARRFDAVHMRTEDRLNDSYLKRLVNEIATEVLSAVVVLPMRNVWSEKDLAAVKHDPAGHDAAVDTIAATLVGLAPQAQGGILAATMAQWIAGWPPDLRAEELQRWIHLVTQLVPVVERRTFGPKGHPVGET